MPYKDPQKNREAARAWRQTHPEAVRERQRIYYLMHRGEVLERVKTHAQAHRASLREYQRTYRQEHLDAIRERKRSHRLVHREADLDRQRAYHQSHQEALCAYQRVYAAAHPAIGQAANTRRRARKSALPGTLTAEQWLAIQVAYKHRCAYCGAKPKKLTQDHVVPISKGGGTTSDNIVPACRSCNSSKHTGPPPVIPPVRLLI